MVRYNPSHYSSHVWILRTSYGIGKLPVYSLPYWSKFSKNVTSKILLFSRNGISKLLLDRLPRTWVWPRKRVRVCHGESRRTSGKSMGFCRRLLNPRTQFEGYRTSTTFISGYGLSSWLLMSPEEMHRAKSGSKVYRFHFRHSSAPHDPYSDCKTGVSS